MGSFDQQVAVASKDFAELWKRAAPRLAKTHHVKFPGRMRPVEFMEPVVLEDVFSRLIGVLQALHDGYGRTQGEHAGLWLDQQLAGCPSLQKAVRDIPISCWKRGLSEAGWRRRLSQNAEQVLGVLLGKDARTLRCFFASEAPRQRQSQIWFRDFDIERGAFESQIHRAKLKTDAGIFDMQPQPKSAKKKQ